MQLRDNICIIPARGGSKRLPNKNIMDFFGKPVIAYAIECAKKSQLFDTVFVSTDSEKIAEIAVSYGAEVSFLRSAETSSDHATTMAVLDEVLFAMKAKGREFRHVLCLYPVTPLVHEKDLHAGLQALPSVAGTLVFPVIEFAHPIWRALSIENGKGHRIWDEYTELRTQDLQPTYHDAGQWYWLHAEDIIRGHVLSRLTPHPFVVPETRAQDVDTPTDWKLLELKFQILKDDEDEK